MAFNVTPISIPAINFRFRSPYSFPSMALPPEGMVAGGAPLSVNQDGNIVIAGAVLTPYHSNTPGPNQQVSPTFDQGAYGDEQSVVVTFTGAGFSTGGSYVLLRPSNQRTNILIQNNTLGKLFYAFNRDADNVSCIAIAAGASREWDVRVPQGNLSLFALGAGTAVIAFTNNNVT